MDEEITIEKLIEQLSDPDENVKSQAALALRDLSNKGVDIGDAIPALLLASYDVDIHTVRDIMITLRDAYQRGVTVDLETIRETLEQLRKKESQKTDSKKVKEELTRDYVLVYNAARKMKQQNSGILSEGKSKPPAGNKRRIVRVQRMHC